MKSFYIVGGRDGSISRMFTEKGYKEVDELSIADIAVFTGGEDVSPDLYGEYPHPRTYYNFHRDDYESSIYHSIDATTLRVGICRGGQFLNVMNGGKMWQDVDNHAIRGTHMLIYHGKDGKPYHVGVTSTHHQMMRPNHGGAEKNYEVWGVAMLSTHRDTGTDINRATDYEADGLDTEIVWYPKTRSLCFQPHPEYDAAKKSGCTDLFFECIERAMAA